MLVDARTHMLCFVWCACRSAHAHHSEVRVFFLAEPFVLPWHLVRTSSPLKGSQVISPICRLLSKPLLAANSSVSLSHGECVSRKECARHRSCPVPTAVSNICRIHDQPMDGYPDVCRLACNDRKLLVYIARVGLSQQRRRACFRDRASLPAPMR